MRIPDAHAALHVPGLRHAPRYAVPVPRAPITLTQLIDRCGLHLLHLLRYPYLLYATLMRLCT